MNEKLKKLAEQATELDYTTFDSYNHKTVEHYKFNREKFAELIVFECVNAVMDGTKEGDHYAQRIEQHFDNGPGGILHFGVEE